MKKQTSLLILTAALYAPALLAQHDPPGKMASGQHAMQMGSSAMSALKGLSGKEFNIAFLSQMIAHHQGALDMAREALKAAKHAETKKEARKVVLAQTKEIRQLTAWLKQWYGVKPSQEQMNRVKADMKGMMSMETASDRMFFEMMIPHHQGAIDMSQLALKKSDKAQVKTLARNIIKAQKAEIALYRRLLHHAK